MTLSSQSHGAGPLPGPGAATEMKRLVRDFSTHPLLPGSVLACVMGDPKTRERLHPLPKSGGWLPRRAFMLNGPGSVRISAARG